jgi:DNA (cytosine-5)-methyltransferase 1
VWPEPTHGPGRALPYRTAAECLDFSLPVPSIFLTQRQANAWAKKHGLPKSSAPRRPLAPATKRRIARGVQRFVLDAAEPFIVNNLTNNVPRPVSEPLATILTGGHKALVQPLLAPLVMNNSETRGDRVYSAGDPIRTLTAEGCRTYQLVTPVLAKFHGEHAGRDGEARGQRVDEPIRTLDTSNRFALIAPTLINTRNGERAGQAPRVLDIREPYNTVTAQGSQGALVAAFLAEHNAGHEATGQKLSTPIDTVTTKDSKALVTSHLMKLRGDTKDHPNTAQDVREPVPTLTAGGTHIAEVRAFLVKYYGTKKDGRPVDAPLDTITTKERYGLVTVMIGGEEYAIVDIGMRMLTPRELFLCQGFPPSYEIHDVPTGLPTDLFGTKATQRLTKKAQTRLVGNSVPPHVAAAIIAANLTQATAEAVA